MSTIETPLYLGMSEEELRRRVEEPHGVRLWGAEQTITPCLFHNVYGDGQKLVAVSPILHRPQYVVVRVGTAHFTCECAADEGVPCTVDTCFSELCYHELIGDLDCEWPEWGFGEGYTFNPAYALTAV